MTTTRRELLAAIGAAAVVPLVPAPRGRALPDRADEWTIVFWTDDGRLRWRVNGAEVDEADLAGVVEVAGNQVRVHHAPFWWDTPSGRCGVAYTTLNHHDIRTTPGLVGQVRLCPGTGALSFAGVAVLHDPPIPVSAAGWGVYTEGPIGQWSSPGDPEATPRSIERFVAEGA